MHRHEIIQIGFFVFMLFLLSPILGGLIARLLDREQETRFERCFLKITGCGSEGMHWKQYGLSALMFGGMGYRIV